MWFPQTGILELQKLVVYVLMEWDYLKRAEATLVVLIVCWAIEIRLYSQQEPLRHALFHVQVIYFTDALDEYLMQHLTEYEDKKLQDASKDNLKIGGKESKAKTKELEKTYKKLTKWWKDLLNSENLEAVKVTFL